MKMRQWLITGLLVAAFPVQGELLKPIELTDAQLAQLRGKFVMPGRIVSFGVIMSSTWQAANGQMLGGEVSMQMQQGMALPVFNVSLSSSGGRGSLPAGTGQVVGGGGLGQVQGVSQSARSAGDFNVTHNGVNIDVRESSQLGRQPHGSTTLGTSVRSSSLGEVRVEPAGGGLQVSIQAAGQGSSMQRIGGGSLTQSTDIISSRNNVENLTQLNVVMSKGSPSINGLNSAMPLVRPGM
ncbi:hypothetical protein D3C76_441820 [compost metagenome]